MIVMAYILERSVHDIVDVLCRRGHLDNRIFNLSSMQEGTRLHNLYQGEQGSDYLSEYTLSHAYQIADYVFRISGKADGVFLAQDGSITIEEIKTTVADLDEFAQDHSQWHLAQAIFYADMICLDRHLDHVRVVLTYLHQTNFRKRKRIELEYSAEEVHGFVLNLLERYSEYMNQIRKLKEERDESAKNIVFPYPTLRPGQEKMMSFVRDCALEGENGYIEAPTGIGKTLSVLYPLLTLFAERKCDHVFYLTSKNAIKTIAMDGIKQLVEGRAKVKSLLVTSQDNICPNDRKGHCNPDECPLARNYYDHLVENIFELLSRSDSIDKETILSFALEKKICPFQFQLDLSRYVDVLVCDYTYVYDYHDRLGLSESSIPLERSYLLVDECHNLPERVREMYSIEIPLALLKKARTTALGPELKALRGDLRQLEKVFQELPAPDQGEILPLEETPGEVSDLVEDFLLDFKAVLRKTPFVLSEELFECFYALNSFSFLEEKRGSHPEQYLLYALFLHGEILSLRLVCLDPTPPIRDGNRFFRSALFFSATLSPKDYYIDLLGGDEGGRKLVLPSPFPRQRRLVLLDALPSLRYRDREDSLPEVVRLIRECVLARKGNYFVFLPSFEYLSMVEELLRKEEGIDILAQGRMRGEKEREEFLAEFEEQHERYRVGLLVLGGIFSEGIDLIGEKLIGAILVSIGLPQLTYERNHIQAYYATEEDPRKGFRYAYSYPGLNRVLQAAGRVIRSEKDKGVLFFIDRRFAEKTYQSVFAELYPDLKRVFSPSGVSALCRHFWEETK